MAVYAAREGDTILIYDSDYNESIFLTKNLKFVGVGNPSLPDRLYYNGHSLSLSGFGFGPISVSNMPDMNTVESDGVIYWFLKGNHFKSNKSNAEALVCYNKAIELDSSFVLALNKKAMVLMDMSRYEEAIYILDQAIAIDAYWFSLWGNKGIAFYMLNRYDDAISAYDQVLELKPNSTSYMNLKGNALYSLGKYDDAIQAYDHALSINPQFANAWKNKGASLKALGRMAESDAALAKAKELENEA